MRFTLPAATTVLSLAAFAAAIRNPDNPQDPINCPPDGGADACSKETKVSYMHCPPSTPPAARVRLGGREEFWALLTLTLPVQQPHPH